MLRELNNTNPPYSSIKLNAELNATLNPNLNLNLASTIEDPTIKNIGVIGALFDKNHNIYHRDTRIITGALTIMRDANISMAPDLNFHFYNLLSPIRSDFLAAALKDNCAPKADALILCYLYGTRYGFTTIDMLHPVQRDEAYENFSEAYSDGLGRFHTPREVAVSPFQLRRGFWPRAADIVDAKIIVTYGGKQDELNTDDFISESFYQAAIKTDEKNSPYDKDYGVLVNNAHLKALQSEANPQSEVGRRILKLKPAKAERAEPLLANHL